MFGLLLLIVRRSLRNAPLTLAVLVGLLVLVTLLVAAPLYTAALADVGLRATLADAPLDQRSVRVALAGRLPQLTKPGNPVEVVLGPSAAEQFEVDTGQTLALSERAGGDPIAPILV